MLCPNWLKPVNSGFHGQEIWGFGSNRGVSIALVVPGWVLDLSYFPLLLGSCLPPYLAVTTFSKPLHLSYSLSCDTCSIRAELMRDRIRHFPTCERDMVEPGYTVVENRAYSYLSLGKTTCCSILAFSQLFFWSNNQKPSFLQFDFNKWWLNNRNNSYCYGNDGLKVKWKSYFQLKLFFRD